MGENEQWTGIPMIAMKMIECWLLSDKDAYKRCFGSDLKKMNLPSKPELIWGEKNKRSSDYPKNYFKRVLEEYHKDADRELYVNIAEQTSIHALKEKCMISFMTFYEEFAKFCTL